jgi:hypothetical protein
MIQKLFENALLNQTSASIPDIWFRGTDYFPKNILYKKLTYHDRGHKPDIIKEPVPKIIEDLYNDNKIKTIFHTYERAEWKINRTYQGMSNFGYGIYFANDLSWALDYGEFIVCATINPDFILPISWDKRDDPNDVCYKLMSWVGYYSGNSISIREQSKHFYKALKKINKNKKALYVQTNDASGQLIVYDPSIIHIKCLAEFKTNEIQ